MKNECSVVRDILPLYIEKMVSGETGEAIEEHLEGCPDCRAQLEALWDKPGAEKPAGEPPRDLEAEVERSMRAVRKRLRKRAYTIAAYLAASFAAACVLLHFFPVYRILEIGPVAQGGYYSGGQVAKALFIGSASDRREAQAVLRLADKAFNDVGHTRAENEEEYGLLARYATSVDRYENASFNEHSLELWSAHLGRDEGWIWVYYSSKTFNHDLTTACVHQGIPSLWRVERDSGGEWVVVEIREHP